MSTMEIDDRSRRTLLSRYLRDVTRLGVPPRVDGAGGEEGPAAADMDAWRRRLVEANLAFVLKIARRYLGLGLSFEDLVSEGNVGLLQAARRFDPSRGTRFITYAVWWIRKAIHTALSQQASIRLPRTQQRRIQAVLAAERQISFETGGGADRETVARRLSLSVRRVEQILQARGRVVSIDESIHADSDTPLHEALCDSTTLDPEREFLRGEARARVRRGLMALAERERRVLEERFGLGGEPVRSLRLIGRELGVSCEAIRLIERSAKIRLRRLLGGGYDRPPAGRPLRTIRPRPASAPPDDARRAPRT